MRFTFSVTQRFMAVCLWIENELQSFTETRTLKHIQPFRFTGCFHNYVQSALLNTFTEQHPQSYLPHTQRTKDTVSPTKAGKTKSEPWGFSVTVLSSCISRQDGITWERRSRVCMCILSQHFWLPWLRVWKVSCLPGHPNSGNNVSATAAFPPPTH